MTEAQKKSAKSRILKTSITLFSEKGYSGVGIREIAEKAGVNISMISYYFNGKLGILKEIFNEFHDRYFKCIVNAIDTDIPVEKCIESIIHNIIDFVHDNLELTMITFTTMSLDIPEITDMKIKRVKTIHQSLSGLIEKTGINSSDKIILSIIGPGLLSLVLTHFRLRPIQKKIIDVEFDEAFYKKYKDIISTLFLKGIKGLADKY